MARISLNTRVICVASDLRAAALIDADTAAVFEMLAAQEVAQ